MAYAHYERKCDVIFFFKPCEQMRMMYYLVMTQTNSEKEIPSAPIRRASNWKNFKSSNRKVIGSTPDRSTRNFFFRVCLCHY